jgi:hypothetical protein
MVINRFCLYLADQLELRLACKTMETVAVKQTELEKENRKLLADLKVVSKELKNNKGDYRMEIRDFQRQLAILRARAKKVRKETKFDLKKTAELAHQMANEENPEIRGQILHEILERLDSIDQRNEVVIFLKIKINKLCI